MSLSAHDARARGRSKSPGGRERSRSRSHSRAPSPNPYAAAAAAPEEPDRHGYDYEYAAPVSYQYAAPRAGPGSSASPPTSYTQTSAPQYDVHRGQSGAGVHSIYAHADNYTHAAIDTYRQSAEPQMPGPNYARPGDYMPHPEYSMPGGYNYASPPPPPPPPGAPGARPSHDRSTSLSASGNFSVQFGHGHGNSRPTSPQQQYQQQQQNYAVPISPQASYATLPASPPYAAPSSNYTARPDVHRVPSSGASMPGQFPYAQPPQNISYVAAKPSPSPSYVPLAHRVSSPGPGPSGPGHHVVEIRPGGAPPHPPPGPGPGHGHSHTPSSSLTSLTPRMHRLSVSGGAGAPSASFLPGHAPPGSPLLEAYHGTYQSMSPMPSPMMLPSSLDPIHSSLDDIPSLDAFPSDPHYHYHSSSSSSSTSSPSRHRRHRSSSRISHSRHRSSSRVSVGGPKSVAFHSITSDASTLIAALNTRTFTSTAPLISILPRLTSDEMLLLRAAYKESCIAPGGKGVNLAKHIKVKVGGPFGKACYATALGRWESEAYWANFWYQSNTSRRELLIEALMGRSNAEVRAIKDVFSDKRYGNSLEKCMKAELPANKFRYAMLLVLEERRQEDAPGVGAGGVGGGVYGRGVDARGVKRDADELYRSLVAKEGGETAMIKIVVLRSDAHLKEVLRVYEATYGRNFARDMLRKSTNLVGEILAHILNGVINRPMRDAMLLHHALANYDPTGVASSTTTAMSTSSKVVPERTELLVSRLVRVHWDRPHLDLVKADYRRKYGVALEQDVADRTHGEFGKFCVALVKRY
ncbi:Annexin [Xylona heveae TC161]|uniref:Annexin n=1 Tax=Xylona heveae (strain CBS 132557 / TC161) TaxID=1328760 RepID=A0A165AGU0_XYLHT|nr:Annexin [Xylona heveae TC161]KZF20448.1 Annexin [Xylona heveae TC161]